MKPQVVLVTGASSGIGEAAARRLASAGHTVYAGARRVDRMRPLEAAGVRTLFLDVTDEASMTAAITRINQEAGGVDALVNNAGYGSYGSLEDVPLDEARAQFEVNIFGLARMSQLVLPGMRAKKAGRIVNISSIGGRVTLPLGSWYHASKHALEGLSDCLRMETRDFGIHVSVVQPGGTESEWASITADNLLKTSGSGAYAPMAKGMAAMLKRETSNALPQVPADAIAVLIQLAIESPRPKSRYVGPGNARLLLAARRWLPDRVWDSVILRMAKGMGRSPTKA